MDQIVSVTYARNKLSSILNKVVREGKRFILVRESIPEAVIIPYEEILEKDRLWNQRFEQTMKKSQKYFEKWLKTKGVNSKTLTEEKVYELIKKA
ncbi:type II toxin-antitoxin system Phd/YefM family antitoxin [Candidatus Microgenomates bacterium]|nr:type II toxin-antitoxin system Phd/YefM family antitoxin [Candidatus Microgenomates bacterium]